MAHKKVALATLGCKANQYDSAVLEGMLHQGGWSTVDFQSPADAYIINTCTVTNKADSEARHLIRRAHRQNPEATILVTGCAAQVNPRQFAAVEGVSFILGNTRKKALLDYLEKDPPLVPEIVVEDIFQEEELFTSGFTHYSKNTRAFLKIQDGCNQMCSYCVIPFARGRNRSLSPEKVLQELKRLAEEGFQEAVLTGIHIGTYGRDLASSTTLLNLMRRIEEARPIHRVRLSSIDPEEVDFEMVDFLSQSNIFCPYLHIPLQSGEDTILKLMRRRYLVEDFRRLAFELKEKIPSICLGTDVMVGFPYEDEERFEKSFDRVEKTPLDYLHVFPYSAKEKTRAARFLNQVSPAEKKSRVQRMTELSRRKREAFFQSSVGSSAEIILEERVSDFQDPSGCLKGISRNYIPVTVPAEDEMKGRLVFARIREVQGGHVVGEIISG